MGCQLSKVNQEKLLSVQLPARQLLNILGDILNPKLKFQKFEKKIKPYHIWMLDVGVVSLNVIKEVYIMF